MGCKNKRRFWSHGSGRFKIIPPGTILPGQDGPVHPDWAGFSGKQSKGMHHGQIIEVDCRVCPGCIQRYQNALIGSCLAETVSAETAVRLDMTYANDPGSDTRSDLAHKMLTPGHLRQFTERMRKARGFGRCRYLIAGEYGPLRGRAHWHAVLIFEDGMPPFDFSAERYNDDRLWPFGFVRARPVTDQASIAYAVKYAVKSTKAMQDNQLYMPGVDTVMRRSRIPPLGLPFFLDQARQQADFGIPLAMNYMPPGGVRKADYHVRGLASRLRMAHAYLDGLQEAGYDVAYFQDRPLGYQPRGLPIPVSPDKDICRLIETACRERRLASLPLVTPEQEAADLVAEFAERQVKQERINAAQAERRHSAAVARAIERNKAFSLSFRSDPTDPFWSDDPDTVLDRSSGSR